jgi:Cytochrome c7 and related cytochrome c
MRTSLLCIVALLGLLGSAPPGAAAEHRSHFDHLTTGFELLGRHRELPCEACHVNAVFKGTPRDCVSCHGAGTQVRATAKPTNHIMTTDRCEACHTPAAWLPAVNFDHTQTLGSCSSCHNNVQAQGMGPQHIATTQQCNACHTTLGWTGVRFNHAGITGGCASCHNGATATGLPANHIPTNGAPCEDCHLPTQFASFLGAVMDHAVVASLPCSSCHEAGKIFAGTPAVTTRPPLPHPASGECASCHTTANWNATDVPANHIPLPAADNNNCALCHSDQSNFALYTMNHANISGNCAQCHGPGLSFANMAPPTLKEPPSNHIPIPAGTPCEDCHSPTQFTNFDGATMDHAAVAATPCSTCHEAGLTFAGTPVVQTRPAAPHPTTGECSTCHTTANWNPNDLPANHIPLPAADNNNCALCHSDQTNFALYTMNHVNISSGCAACHGPGLSFANMAPPALKEPPSNHIPIPAGTPCEDCHSPTQFTNFDGSTMDHAVVTATPCSTCHEAGKSFAGTPVVETRPVAPHPATGECSNCHSTANWNATSLPANHIPLPTADNGNCALCHTNPSDYSVYTMNHVNITSNCAQCHGPGLAFANMAPPTLKQPPTGPPPHVPYGTAACEACHTATVFTSFSGTIMRHAAVTGAKCDSCHELGMAWYGEPNLWVRPDANHHAGQDCGNSGCHTPRDKRQLRPAATTPAPKRPAAGTAVARGVSGAVATRISATRLSGATGLMGPQRAGMGAMAAALSSQSVDHSGLTGACIACHNGRTAVGAPAGHLGFSARCDSCHTTNAWLPARFDHLAMAARSCSGCHNGVQAMGMPSNHVPTIQPCSACHGTLAWQPVRVNHLGLVSGCAKCHNNVAAVGLTITHFRTQLDCSACHRYPDWGVIVFRHASASVAASRTRGLACTTCHTSNSEQVTRPGPGSSGPAGGPTRPNTPARPPVLTRHPFGNAPF